MQKLNIVYVYITLTVYVIHPSQNTSPEMATTGGRKHVAGYAVYNTTDLHICICTCWSYFSHWVLCLPVTYSAYVLLHIQAPVSVSVLLGVQTVNDDHTLPLGTLESKHNLIHAMNTEYYTVINGTSVSLCQDQTFHEQLSTVLFHKAFIWTGAWGSGG